MASSRAPPHLRLQRFQHARDLGRVGAAHRQLRLEFGVVRLEAQLHRAAAHRLNVVQHLVGPALADAISSCRPDRIVGAGGLRSRDDAMEAGEQDADYVMFGEPARDGWSPPAEQVLERAGWWTEIFNVPCVAYAATLADVAALAQTRVDFIALRDAVWNDPRGPAAAVRDAQAAIAAVEGAA